jgi:serine/threonine protein kinase
MKCQQIYKSGVNIGKECMNQAKWIILKQGIQCYACGIHSKGHEKIKIEENNIEFNDLIKIPDNKLNVLLENFINNEIGVGLCSRVFILPKNVSTQYFNDFAFDLVYKKYEQNAKYETIENELRAMKLFKSEYIIKCICFDETGLILERGIALVQFVCNYTNLETDSYSKYFYKQIRSKNNKSDMKYFIEFAKHICLGLKYIHNIGFIHCDIKRDNIIITYNEINGYIAKISDFGSCFPELVYTRPPCFTKAYSPPEYFSIQQRNSFTKKYDIWSLGIVLFYIINHEHIIDIFVDHEKEKKKKINSLINFYRKGEFIVNKKISEIITYYSTLEPLELFETNKTNIIKKILLLIKKMLSYSPKKRPNIMDIVNELSLIVKN